MAAPVTVFDRLSALADSTRSRLLLLLDRNELTVSELCAITQLPQSTVSRHLRVLSDDGWVVSRAEGTSRLYAVEPGLDAYARKLWELVKADVSGAAQARHDALRLAGVLEERRSTSQAFFSTASAQWDTMRAELFGTRADTLALLALLDERWTVGDLGCGTGQLAATLAPFVERVVGVDGSRAMLSAARKRLAKLDNVEVRAGDLESLPIADGELDAALLALVLHHVAEPARVLAESHRALSPGGRVLVVDMLPHDRQEYRRTMGHVWLGFGEEQLAAWLREAGFARVRYVSLPIDPSAKGPTLFVCTAVKG
jgi:ArsR family transcriptional regulator